MPSEAENNQEIADALAEFEAKSEVEEIPQNLEISEISQVPINTKSIEPSKITQKVMKYSGGLVKNEDQANYVLLGFAILAFSISIYLVFF